MALAITTNIDSAPSDECSHAISDGQADAAMIMLALMTSAMIMTTVVPDDEQGDHDLDEHDDDDDGDGHDDDDGDGDGDEDDENFDPEQNTMHRSTHKESSNLNGSGGAFRKTLLVSGPSRLFDYSAMTVRYR